MQERRSQSHAAGLNLDIGDLSISVTEGKENADMLSDSELGFSIGKSIKDAGPVNEVVDEKFRKLPSLVKMFNFEVLAGRDQWKLGQRDDGSGNGASALA